MTKRDFFRIMIKLFGLYFIIAILFSTIPGNILFALEESSLVSYLWIIIAIVVSLLLFVLLLFKVDVLIQVLKLDKGFDNELIQFGNFNPKEILSLGIVIIGGLLIIDNLPGFLSQVLFALKDDLRGETSQIQDNFYLATGIIKILIGYLLVTNYDRISHYFSKVR